MRIRLIRAGNVNSSETDVLDIQLYGTIRDGDVTAAWTSRLLHVTRGAGRPSYVSGRSRAGSGMDSTTADIPYWH